MPEKEEQFDFTSLAEAACYMSSKGKEVGRQAVYKAIRFGELKAKKIVVSGQTQWGIKKEDLDSYLASRNKQTKRKANGQKIFDGESTHLSVNDSVRLYSSLIGWSVPPHHLYYLLRVGFLPGKKRGGMWVIEKKEIENLASKHINVKIELA